MIYRVVLEKGEDFGNISHCPAIPGCHSQGKTIEMLLIIKMQSKVVWKHWK
jgi:predicted RNase H-like HicB family nuclease